MARTLWAAFLAVFLAAPQVLAQQPRPRLVVAVAVDQLSADVFAASRGRFTGGFARLLGGAVFPSGFQSHANTETCPGHSTILTGARPARTGIIANTWYDPRIARDDKSVYCVEDERIPGTSAAKYVVSPLHLKALTLGDRLKADYPRSRVVAVAGKDRAAVAMAGRHPDEIWWWRGTEFMSYAGAKMPAAVAAANASAKKLLEGARPARSLPPACRAQDASVEIEPGRTVGDGRLARAANEGLRHQASPDADETVLDLALTLAKDMKLGQGAATDVLAVGLSATDYVGHVYGSQGAEMCIHLLALDELLDSFFKGLDAMKTDYVVVMTADHGAQDIPERGRVHGAPDAHRVDGSLSPVRLGEAIAKDLGLSGKLLYAEPYGIGDFWIEPKLAPVQRAEVLKRALAYYGAHPDVAAVFTREQILAAAIPAAPPDEWSLIERVRASYDPSRSGDFYVALKPRVGAYEASSRPYTAGHGTPWDYDRRVPIIFWRAGMTGFEQPFAVETVDILPTLAALIGLKVPAGEIDGRCLFGCR